MNSKEDHLLLLPKLKNACLEIIKKHETEYIENHKYDLGPLGGINRKSRTLNFLNIMRDDVNALCTIDSDFTEIKTLLDEWGKFITKDFQQEILQALNNIAVITWNEERAANYFF